MGSVCAQAICDGDKDNDERIGELEDLLRIEEIEKNKLKSQQSQQTQHTKNDDIKMKESNKIPLRPYHFPIYISYSPQDNNYDHRLYIHYLHQKIALFLNNNNDNDLNKKLTDVNDEIIKIIFNHFHVKIYKTWRWLNLCDSTIIADMKPNKKFELEEKIKIGLKVIKWTGDKIIEYMDIYPTEPLYPIFVKYRKKVPSDVYFNFENEPLNIYDKRYLNYSAQDLGMKHGQILCVNNNDFDTSNQYQIFIKTLTGKTITLLVNGNYDVFDLKYGINCKEGIAIKQLRIIHAGKQLNDGDTLSDYKISAESTVHCVAKLRGS